jgi:arsenate reductase
MRGSSVRRTRPANPGAPGPAPLSGRSAPAASSSNAARKLRVLFVCIGNSCRSQMAEAFAKAYGSDILEVSSAGLSPAAIIAPLTRQVLAMRHLNIEGQFPKDLEMVTRNTATHPFDVVVNISGMPMHPLGHRQIDWKVQDPIGHPEAVHRAVADQLEGLVMRLILELRKGI